MRRRNKYRRDIQSIATGSNLMPQAWKSAPKQGHSTGNVRSCHGGAAGSRIRIVAAITSRTRIGSRSSDVGFDAVTSISCHRSAAAKPGNCISASIQCAHCVRCLINTWRIRHRGTGGTGVTRCDYHHDTSSGLSFDSSLQSVRGAAFRSRTTPGVNGYIGRFGRIALAAAYWVRRQKELHALDVGRRRTYALVHIPACDELRARSNTYLIARAIVSDGRSSCVRPVIVIITRR